MSTVAYIPLDTVTGELSAQRGEPVAPGAAEVLTRNITAASRMIDRYKGVEPGGYKTSEQATDTVRYFGADGTGKVLIDRATSVAEVAIWQGDGSYRTLTLDTDYHLWPYNAAQVGEPYRWLVSDKTVFPRRIKGVKVTGKWGVSASVPYDIERACGIQVVRWYMRALNSWQDSNLNPMGGLNFAQSLDPDVKLLLDKAYPHGSGI
jgi:hypothetical protein